MSETEIKHISRQGRLANKKKLKLMKEFGGKCTKCKSTDQLEFSHKVGFRYNYGRSRGKLFRMYEIEKNKHKFVLLCATCHRQYDKDNPFTEEELKIIQEKQNNYVPF
jgi:hypothetical protein